MHIPPDYSNEINRVSIVHKYHYIKPSKALGKNTKRNNALKQALFLTKERNERIRKNTYTISPQNS